MEGCLCLPASRNNNIQQRKRFMFIVKTNTKKQDCIHIMIMTFIMDITYCILSYFIFAHLSSSFRHGSDFGHVSSSCISIYYSSSSFSVLNCSVHCLASYFKIQSVHHLCFMFHYIYFSMCHCLLTYNHQIIIYI